MITQKWIVKKALPVSKEIEARFPNPMIQQILARNNVDSIDKVSQFIDPKLYVPSPSTEIPDLEIATRRLHLAIRNKEKIGVWGDFDVDGQTSTTLLWEGLTKLGADLVFHIPIRSKESHGIKLDPLKEFLENKISILLTCDTGISEHESIQYATQNGIDVLVTDHHSLPSDLPNAMANVNPQRLPEGHPLRTLAGVGVAYKLIEFLYELSGRSNECTDLLDLVALGTIADVAILRGENRYLTQLGLELLQQPQRLGLQEIYKNRKFGNGRITETHIGFYIAPLMNALGRLSDANQIVEFLTSKDLQKVKVFATQLENLNGHRKLITEQITEAVLSKIDRNTELLDEPSIIMHHSGWEAGVLGIVANRLVELYQKPTILLTGNEETGFFGSARSIEQLNIIDVIRSSATYLNHLGGHAMAAGLSLDAENFQNFKNSFNKKVLEIIGDEILTRELLIDGFVDFDQINLNFVKELETLSPFGAGNPTPIFASKNITIENLRKIGRKGEHLKIFASDSNEKNQEFIWWRGNLEEVPDEEVDIAFNLHSNTYQGRENVQVEIVSIQPSESTLQELKSSLHDLVIHDYRKIDSLDPEWKENFDSFLWFQEGLVQDFTPSHNRLNLEEADTLILYTIPPNLTELQKIFLLVHPKQLVLFANYPIIQSINSIIKTVAGMLNHVIHNKDGLFEPIQIAAATGQRISTIISICRYLQAIGQISIKEHPDTQWYVTLQGERDLEMAELYKEHIEFLHKETLAFYQWYSVVNEVLLRKSILNTPL